MNQPSTSLQASMARAAMAEPSAGARTYCAALSRAGGTELEAFVRGDDTTAVCVGLYNSPAYDLQVPPLSVSRLSVHLSPARATGALDGERVRTFQAPRHSVYLTPAHAAARWSKDRPSRHLNIYFHRSAFAGDMLEEGLLDERVAPLLNAGLTRVLPGVGALANELSAELEHPGAFTAEAADSLARLLLVRLARLQMGMVRTRSPLTPVALGRVKEFVRANLDKRILVSQMAAVAGLPANRFTQAFTDHTGHSPHQYVLAQRLDLAMSLLSGSRMALAQVASTCGFSSQQHLTHTMRARLGITPARFRAGDPPQA